MPSSQPRETEGVALSERQAAVLRAVVDSYVGEAAPIGSRTISHLLSAPLSPASVRNTLAELTELGLVEKPHRSAGRLPTERGMRTYVDSLLNPAGVVASERREIAYQLEEAQLDGAAQRVSWLLSMHTRQLGFVLTPSLERVVLRHVSLVRLSSEQILLVLVSQTGTAHRRVLSEVEVTDQIELDRIAALLNERVVGRTLPELRRSLEREAHALRREARSLLRRAVELGVRALSADGDPAGDLVIETRLALLDQPEFHDPRRVRELFEALETKARLIEVLDHILAGEGVRVAFGDELDDPVLRDCALVVATYGGVGDAPPMGALGVIGPQRMDFKRVVSLVEYLSEVSAGVLSG